MRVDTLDSYPATSDAHLARVDRFAIPVRSLTSYDRRHVVDIIGTAHKSHSFALRFDICEPYKMRFVCRLPSAVAVDGRRSGASVRCKLVGYARCRWSEVEVLPCHSRALTQNIHIVRFALDHMGVSVRVSV